jgi:hypothetical protein
LTLPSTEAAFPACSRLGGWELPAGCGNSVRFQPLNVEASWRVVEFQVGNKYHPPRPCRHALSQLQRPGLPPPTALIVALAQDHDLHLVEWADASKVALEGPVTKSADLEHIIVNSYPLQLVTGGATAAYGALASFKGLERP